jgi:hypothetical protein
VRLLGDSSKKVATAMSHQLAALLPHFVDADSIQRSQFSSQLLPVVTGLCRSQSKCWQNMSGIMAAIPILLQVCLSGSESKYDDKFVFRK